MAAIRYTTLHSQLVKFSRGCVFLLFTLLLKRRRVNFSAKILLLFYSEKTDFIMWRLSFLEMQTEWPLLCFFPL